MVIKRSPGGQACRWRAVNFEIHLWSSGKNADCIFGDRSASSMSKWRPAWTLTPEMIPFRTKSVTLSMLIDLLTSTMSCRSTQVKIASTDLWPQEMFTFSEMLALVESESSFGAYVCHRRPGGSRATSDLVNLLIRWTRCDIPITIVVMIVREKHPAQKVWFVLEREFPPCQVWRQNRWDLMPLCDFHRHGRWQVRWSLRASHPSTDRRSSTLKRWLIATANTGAVVVFRLRSQELWTT